MGERVRRAGWVKDDDERAAREEELRSVEGREIVAVRYFGLTYEGGPAPSWHADGFDALDHGLELDLDDERTVAAAWQVPGYNEALLVYIGRLEPDEILPGAATSEDVSAHWLARGPRRIGALAFAWKRWEWGAALNATGEVVSPPGMTDLCLETVVIADGQREAAITLGDVDGKGGFAPSATNVAVFFSLALARAAGARLPVGASPFRA